MVTLVQTRQLCKKYLIMLPIFLVSGARCFHVSNKSYYFATRLSNQKFLRRRLMSDRIPVYDGNLHPTCYSTRQKSSINDYSIEENNVISSSQSATVKKVQAILSKRKKRREYCQTIVEGPRMVFDLLQSPMTENLVRQVLISTDDFRKEYKDRLTQLSLSVSPQIQLVTPAILKACCDTVTPQGIVALVDIPSFLPVGGTRLSDTKYPFYLVLDGVSDPGNVGTLLRSSLAVGVSGVLLLPECCDVWNPKAVRSAMGASFQLPIFEISSWEEAVEKMTTEWNVQQIYAATMMEEIENETRTEQQKFSQPHYNIDWLAQPSALVIGSEGNGLSVDVRNSLLLDSHSSKGYQIGAVHVPMESGIESLNAAICGSVIMFEYSRQCASSRT